MQESVTRFSAPPHPHRCLFLLRGSGERAGGDAAGGHVVLTLFPGGPLAREGPVCAALLSSPLFVYGCELYASGPYKGGGGEDRGRQVSIIKICTSIELKKGDVAKHFMTSCSVNPAFNCDHMHSKFIAAQSYRLCHKTLQTD